MLGFHDPCQFYALPAVLQDLWLGHVINKATNAYLAKQSRQAPKGADPAVLARIAEERGY